ncbi:hypothetical protein ACXM2N_03395 [Corynebacterium sp. ZY180755]
MISNYQRALDLAYHIAEVDEAPRELVKQLHQYGLLAPDLPEPDDKRANGDASWAIIGKAAVDTWHDEGGPVVELRAGRGRYLIPAEARQLARILLAAADHAEVQAHE